MMELQLLFLPEDQEDDPLKDQENVNVGIAQVQESALPEFALRDLDVTGHLPSSGRVPLQPRPPPIPRTLPNSTVIPSLLALTTAPLIVSPSTNWITFQGQLNGSEDRLQALATVTLHMSELSDGDWRTIMDAYTL